MPEIQPVNVISCMPNGCNDRMCLMSGTVMCCRDCGNPVHQKQIIEFLESPPEASKLINMLTKEHKCKFACEMVGF